MTIFTTDHPSKSHQILWALVNNELRTLPIETNVLLRSIIMGPWILLLTYPYFPSPTPVWQHCFALTCLIANIYYLARDVCSHVTRKDNPHAEPPPKEL